MSLSEGFLAESAPSGKVGGMVQTADNLVMPVRGAKLWPMSVEAYHVLGEAGVIPKNTELLYGLVYTRMPISPYHAFLLSYLLELLRKVARDRYIRSEMPITCPNSEPQPDICVVKGTFEDYRREHPRTAELVIEICVTSHEYDRSKLKAYASAGVKECWLVLGPEKQIEVYREPANGEFLQKKIYDSDEVVASVSVPEFSLGVTEVFLK
jgi:Uma2 family endonuclease